MDEAACTAAVTRAEWPARLQRLRRGPLVEAAGSCELWLDGGHNPAAGAALAEALDPPAAAAAPPRHRHAPHQGRRRLPPPARRARACSLHGVSIPGEPATLTAEETVAAARAAGFTEASRAADVADAVAAIAAAAPGSRILICGSLYLAGRRAARERLTSDTLAFGPRDENPSGASSHPPPVLARNLETRARRRRVRHAPPPHEKNSCEVQHEGDRPDDLPTISRHQLRG